MRPLDLQLARQAPVRVARPIELDLGFGRLARRRIRQAQAEDLAVVLDLAQPPEPLPTRSARQRLGDRQRELAERTGARQQTPGVRVVQRHLQFQPLGQPRGENRWALEGQSAAAGLRS